ncbi:hypothetical protein BDK51DRAFT_46629 [Blyttiomyces helicus]|uniref:Uncharacterized protein n=1 Tax=Blyttiomyces helicus TaxID=388810 RepID=A0A4P9WFT6_9FUNG|nr:hypothetical protein BDK51DRAFT_46629 [Blyttiomyces helicus]|eukprot:RKO90643.1 hypothetical protein BDK51DRAFT_46629 [Blyttiomyces helicus]
MWLRVDATAALSACQLWLSIFESPRAWFVGREDEYEEDDEEEEEEEEEDDHPGISYDDYDYHEDHDPHDDDPHDDDEMPSVAEPQSADPPPAPRTPSIASRLPAELLALIFGSLLIKAGTAGRQTSRASLLPSTLVSKHWAAAAESTLWSYVGLDSVFSVDRFQLCCAVSAAGRAKAPLSRWLRLQARSYAFRTPAPEMGRALLDVAERTINLRALDVGGEQIDDTTLGRIFAACPSLVALHFNPRARTMGELDPRTAAALVAGFKRMEILDLSVIEDEAGPPHLLRIATGSIGPALRFLSFSASSPRRLAASLHESRLPNTLSLLGACPLLETLVLAVDHLSDAQFGDIAAKAAGLRHVRLRNCPRLTDAAMVALATHCPRLRALETPDSNFALEPLAGSFLPVIAARCPNVGCLLLKQALVACAPLADFLGNGGGAALRVLDVSEMPYIVGDEALAIVAGGCPRLEQLDVGGSGPFTDAVVRSCVEALVVLRVLRVRSSQGRAAVSEEMEEELARVYACDLRLGWFGSAEGAIMEMVGFGALF